jgi:predicted enzyme related to lactoylglutathione lyase
MADMTKYEPGTPSWVDLGSPNTAESAAFYKRLFGWEVIDQGPDAGGYAIFQLRGKNVAGLGPLMDPNQPPSWTTYVSVDDLDKTVTRVEEAGGTVIVPPMDVFDAGRMAIAVDPTGAFFAMWQPIQHIGAEIVNEANSLCWNELNTRDTAAAASFYNAVFGWTAKTSSDGGMEYTEFQVGDRSVAGMMGMSDDMPAEVPSHWLTYFAVDDADAAVQRAEEGGGRTVTPLMDISVGRFAVLTDPHGAVFAIIKMTEAS